MTEIEIVDNACLIAAFVLPIFFVLRWNLIGVALGALAHWGALILAGLFLSESDPGRDANFLDAVWIMAGWIVGLIYSTMIYGVKMIMLAILRATSNRER